MYKIKLILYTTCVVLVCLLILDSLPSLLQAHVKAQLSKKTQLLAIMSRKHQELESRLDGMITRIHKETQEIKELEQQLTDGEEILRFFFKPLLDKKC